MRWSWTFRKKCAFTVLVSAACVLANQPPVVHATVTPDSPATGAIVRLVGSASDDSTGYDQLSFQWTQVSGPADAQIDDPSSDITTATFTASGAYVLELRAGDGALFGRDTLTVAVHQVRPFVVLAPANDAQVPVGATYVIRWQMDPSIPCMVRVSWDDGLNWQIINGAAVKDSFAWQVDPGLTPGTRGTIKVEEYNVSTHFAEGTFRLADGSASVRQEMRANPRSADTDSSSGTGCGAGVGLALIPPLGTKLRRARAKSC